ncbi:hypothetical protein [Thermodesulfovibrio yellowstonii]|uniref:hypothetical protein n=1 Tax=Thermodesulfovibrio yellowstonii TaxID=28262 RepID=UPI003C7B61C3
MVLEAKVTGMSVTKHCVSIRLSSSHTEKLYVDSIRELKGVKQRYVIEFKDEEKKTRKVSFNGRVQSINIRRGLFFVIHASREKWVIINIAAAVDEKVVLKFLTRKELLLIDLVKQASHLLNMPEEDVLYQFTTFTDKSGQVRPGKRSIYELSDKRKDVVIDKLSKLIQSVKETDKVPENIKK